MLSESAKCLFTLLARKQVSVCNFMYIPAAVPDCRETGHTFLTPKTPAWVGSQCQFFESQSLLEQTVSQCWRCHTGTHSVTVLEVEKSTIKAPTDLASGESPLRGSQTAIFLLCLHMIEVGRELSEASLQGTIPLMRALPS